MKASSTRWRRRPSQVQFNPLGIEAAQGDQVVGVRANRDSGRSVDRSVDDERGVDRPDDGEGRTCTDVQVSDHLGALSARVAAFADLSLKADVAANRELGAVLDVDVVGGVEPVQIPADDQTGRIAEGGGVCKVQGVDRSADLNRPAGRHCVECDAIDDPVAAYGEGTGQLGCVVAEDLIDLTARDVDCPDVEDVALAADSGGHGVCVAFALGERKRVDRDDRVLSRPRDIQSNAAAAHRIGFDDAARLLQVVIGIDAYVEPFAVGRDDPDGLSAVEVLDAERPVRDGVGEGGWALMGRREQKPGLERSVLAWLESARFSFARPAVGGHFELLLASTLAWSRTHAHFFYRNSESFRIVRSRCKSGRSFAYDHSSGLRGLSEMRGSDRNPGCPNSSVNVEWEDQGAQAVPAKRLANSIDHFSNTASQYKPIAKSRKRTIPADETMLHPLLSRKVDRFTESVIRGMSVEARRYGAVNLAQGMPDFAAPAEIKRAACQAIEDDINQYAVTWGSPKLRQAVAEHASGSLGFAVDPETEITVTCGSTEAMLVALLSTINPGDEVILTQPFYENYWPDCVLAGATPRFVPLRPPGWSFDLQELESAFNDKTKAVVLCNPNNPTGGVLTRLELEFVAGLCRKWDVLAITDEIYEHIVYDGLRHIPIAAIEGMRERSVTISGMSKTFAVTGWRIGTMIAPPKLSRAFRQIHDYVSIGAAAPLQEAGAVAYRLPKSYFDQLAVDYQARRDAFIKTLHAVGFECQAPSGAYYVMANIDAFGTEDDVEFSRRLVREIGVASVPGSSFFQDKSLGSKYVRFCFCKRDETLATAAERLSKLRVVV